METLGHGVFPDGEWECFGRMFATEEHHEHDVDSSSQISHLLGENDGGNFGVQSMFPETGGNKISNMFNYSFDSHHNTDNLQYILSQESSHSSMDNPSHTTNHYVGYPHNVFANNSGELKLKRMLDVSELEMPVDDNIINSSGNPKKKPRASNDVQRLCMVNEESKKNQKKKVGTNGIEAAEETSSSYNMCEENSGGATSPSKLTVNGKTRVSRGSATDPQSLYARKRRERINERLRTLQNLVPNGTKVDISTMLEEAIQYVKFLQLQIKLLSSDDLWMYSPIAYNGLDIGFLSQKISPPP